MTADVSGVLFDIDAIAFVLFCAFLVYCAYRISERGRRRRYEAWRRQWKSRL